MLVAAWEVLDGTPAPLPDEGLSGEERSRAGGFGNERRRAQYLSGRQLLRQVTAAVLGLTAEDVTLNAEGQPRCLNSPRPLWLSLSHSGPLVLAAASDEGPVGVDVEQRDQARDWEALAAGLGWTAPEAGKLEGFLLRWTLKEALFKAALGQAGQAWQSVDQEAVVSVVSGGPSELCWLSAAHPPLRKQAVTI